MTYFWKIKCLCIFSLFIFTQTFLKIFYFNFNKKDIKIESILSLLCSWLFISLLNVFLSFCAQFFWKSVILSCLLSAFVTNLRNPVVSNWTNHKIQCKHLPASRLYIKLHSTQTMRNKNIVTEKWVSNTNVINVPPKDCSEAKVTAGVEVDGYRLPSLTSV